MGFEAQSENDKYIKIPILQPFFSFFEYILLFAATAAATTTASLYSPLPMLIQKNFSSFHSPLSLILLFVLFL